MGLYDDLIPDKNTNLRTAAGGTFRSDAADAWERMVAGAAKEGVNLRIESGGSYRTRAQQAAAHKAKPRLVAPPGHSNHEKGIAVDVAEGRDWVRKNGARYGWNWGERPDEDWHFTYGRNYADRSLGRGGAQATRQGSGRGGLYDDLIPQKAGLYDDLLPSKTPPQSPQDARTARPGTSPTPNTPQQKEAAKLLSRYDAVNRKIDSLQKEIDSTKGAVFGATLGGASLPKANQLRKLKEERDALKKHPLILAKDLADLGIQATKWSAQDIPVKSQESNVDFWKAGIDKANEAPGVLQTVRGAGEGAWNAVKSIPGAIWDQIQSVALNQARVADQMAGVPIEKQVKVPEHLEYSAQAKGLFSSVVDAIAFAGEYATPAVFFLEHKTTPEEFGGRLANAVMWGAGAKGAIEHRVAGVKKRFVEAGVPEEIVESHTPAIENIIRKEQVVSSKPPVEPTVESKSAGRSRTAMGIVTDVPEGFLVTSRDKSGLPNIVTSSDGVMAERFTEKGKSKWRVLDGKNEYVGLTPESAVEIARSRGVDKARPLAGGAPSSTEPRPTSRDTTSKVSQEGGATPPASTRFSNQAKVEVTVEGKKLTPEQVDNIGKPKRTASDAMADFHKSLEDFKKGNYSAGSLGGEKLSKLTEAGAYLFEAGYRTFAEWSTEFVKHAGEGVRDHLQKIWEGVHKKQATGLANQVQEREALQGIIGDVESAGGKDAKFWQERGKAIVDEGTHPESDYIHLSKMVASGDVELTGERVGILQEGKRKLLNEVNRLRERIDSGDASSRTRSEYADVVETLDTYLQHIQAGKGRWSDVGRALQAGTTLDEGNFAEVLAEAKRGGQKLNMKAEQELKRLSDMVAERDARLEKIQREYENSTAEREFQRQQRKREKTATISNIRERRADLKARILGKGVNINAGFDIETAKLFAELVKTYIEEGVTHFDAVVDAISKELGWKKDDVVSAMAARRAKTPTKGEVQEQLSKLTARAKREKGLEGQIEKLKKQIAEGDFKAKTREDILYDRRIAELQVERDLYASKVRSEIEKAKTPPIVRAIRGTAGEVTGFILGQDVGQLGRQGMFLWNDVFQFKNLNPAGGFKNLRNSPAIKAIPKAVHAMFSEKNLAAIEREIALRETADGRPLHPIRQRSGLQITGDTLRHQEELASARLLRKVPIVGKLAGSLIRAQTAWINFARAEVFDIAVEAGWDAPQLTEHARFINDATGRGNMKQVPVALQALMTSPRYEGSRWAMIGRVIKSPATTWKAIRGNKAARYEIVSIGKTAAAIYGAYKLAEAAGYETNLDPDSPDFLALRKGDDVWRLGAGIDVRLRDLLRIPFAIANPQYNHNVGNIIQKIATRTISPAITVPTTQASYALQRRAGVSEDKLKNPLTGLSVDEDERGLWALTPLIWQGFYQAYKADGWGAAMWSATREAFGTSVMRYPKKASPTEKKTSTGTATVPLPGGTNKPKSNLPHRQQSSI